MKFYLLVFILLVSLIACNSKPGTVTGSGTTVSQYFNSGDTGVQSGGVRMIPIRTPVGDFKVWTKRFGNNPRVKVLLLHGGPAMTHEYMECFESFFPKEGF
jgi:proline iminopeptidase